MSVNDWFNMQVYQNIVYIIKYIIFSRIPILYHCVKFSSSRDSIVFHLLHSPPHTEEILSLNYIPFRYLVVAT